MPSIGQGNALSREYGSGLDADALAFAKAAGATDVKTLSAFVAGLKKMNVWSNVIAWPLRSSLNAGTGNTIYSLGNAATVNATNSNGTWTANGISVTATNQKITLPTSAFVESTRSALVVFNSSSTNLNQSLCSYHDVFDANGKTYLLFQYDGSRFGGQYGGPKISHTRNSAFTQNYSTLGTRAINLNAWQSAAFTADNTTDNVFINGSLAAEGARTGLSAINPSGAATTRTLVDVSPGMVQAIVLLSSQKWSNATVLDLHNLCKATVANGLGLP